MGLFDSVIFEKAPVVCKCGNLVNDFQTKSLENLLEDYVITEDGFLMYQEYEIKDVEGEERFHAERVNKDLINTAVCGSVEVHTMCDKCDKYWFSIKLDVNNGQIESIESKTSLLGKNNEDIDLK